MKETLESQFRRGFKTWCETISVQKRHELRVHDAEPLNAEVLAQHLGVAVWPLERVPGLDKETIHHLTVVDAQAWSAATVCAGGRHLVVMNSAHSKGRQASSLMHELAHILIGHEPARLDLTEDGLMILHTYDKTNEKEANWLAAALLLPREALLSIRRQRLSDAAASEKFGCTLRMLKFRFQVTGVDIQLSRATKYVRKAL